VSHSPRLIYWAEVLPPAIGGIETFSAALLPRLVQRGYEVHAVTSDAGGTLPARDDLAGAAVHRLPLREAIAAEDPARLLDGIGQVRRLKQVLGPAVHHLNFSGPMAFFHLRTAGVHPGPMATTFHGMLDRLRGGALLTEIVARSDRLVANSRAVRDDVLTAFPDAGPRTEVIYCGVEPPSGFVPVDLRRPPHLVFVGRLIPEKGADVALDAFAAIRARFPAARLSVAGDGGERDALERRAAALGVADAVDMLGWVRPADVPALLADATLVLMPSRWREPFGLVAVEAALQGRAVVGTAAGGLAEVIEDGVTGRLVARNDAEAVAAAAMALLANGPALAAMGARARERALAMFSIEPAVDALDGLYRQLSAAVG
jgi:glycogen(starch) synthase